MSQLAAIVRRELAAYFTAPIAYVVGVLFLILQGLSFWAVVEVLSDPRRPGTYGAVLETHFGGTPLYWSVLFAVVAVISMRLIADERRQGTWETLMTAPVGEGTVVIGKWIGACAFYAALWLPTLTYVGVLAVFAPGEAGIDLGPIVSAYAGVMLCGAAFLAIGLAASAATSNQIIAAAATFSLLWGLLLIGQLPDIAGDVGPPSPLIQIVDLRAHMLALARGEITAGALALFGALIVVALAAAHRLCVGDRRPRPERRRRSAALGLIAVNALLALALVAHNPASWDVSASRQNSLEPSTRDVLARVDRPIDLLVVRPTAEVFDPVWAEVDPLIARLVRAQPMLHRRDVDPALETERIAELAREFAFAPGDLTEGGAIVVQAGRRRRAIDLLAMAGFERDDLGVGALSQFRAESELAAAISDVIDVEPVTACATGSHGELPLAPAAGGADWSALGDRLRRDGIAIETVTDLAALSPERCRVLIVAGPAHPLSASDAVAIDGYLARGGRLLLAAASRPEPGRSALPATGLEMVIAARGIQLEPAIAVDPDSEVDVPLAWATTAGYGDHPIAAPFAGRRVTVWLAPRVISGGIPLVFASPRGWGERDVAALFAGGDVQADPGERVGAPPVAAAAEDSATGARIVVFGSALSISSEIAGRGLGSADALAAAAVSWLVGRARAVPVGDKMPEYVRLVMTRGQLRATFAMAVIGLPALLAGLGGAIGWRRRRGG